jgi:hypothetical protein
MATENDRFPRWQKIAIDHLSYTVNLILTLTIATLGYWFLLLKDRDFIPASSSKCTMLLSLIALSFSAICGFACIINRMWDFRGTAKRAHGDAHTDSSTKEYLDGLGRITWMMFYCQLFVFVLGVALLAVSLLLTYGGKLV